MSSNQKSDVHNQSDTRSQAIAAQQAQTAAENAKANQPIQNGGRGVVGGKYGVQITSGNQNAYGEGGSRQGGGQGIVGGPYGVILKGSQNQDYNAKANEYAKSLVVNAGLIEGSKEYNTALQNYLQANRLTQTTSQNQDRSPDISKPLSYDQNYGYSGGTKVSPIIAKNFDLNPIESTFDISKNKSASQARSSFKSQFSSDQGGVVTPQSRGKSFGQSVVAPGTLIRGSQKESDLLTSEAARASKLSPILSNPDYKTGGKSDNQIVVTLGKAQKVFGNKTSFGQTEVAPGTLTRGSIKETVLNTTLGAKSTYQSGVGKPLGVDLGGKISSDNYSNIVSASPKSSTVLVQKPTTDFESFFSSAQTKGSIINIYNAQGARVGSVKANPQGRQTLESLGDVSGVYFKEARTPSNQPSDRSFADYVSNFGNQGATIDLFSGGKKVASVSGPNAYRQTIPLQSKFPNLSAQVVYSTTREGKQLSESLINKASAVGSKSIDILSSSGKKIQAIPIDKASQQLPSIIDKYTNQNVTFSFTPKEITNPKETTSTPASILALDINNLSSKAFTGKYFDIEQQASGFLSKLSAESKLPIIPQNETSKVFGLSLPNPSKAIGEFGSNFLSTVITGPAKSIPPLVSGLSESYSNLFRTGTTGGPATKVSSPRALANVIGQSLLEPQVFMSEKASQNYLGTSKFIHEQIGLPIRNQGAKIPEPVENPRTSGAFLGTVLGLSTMIPTELSPFSISRIPLKVAREIPKEPELGGVTRGLSGRNPISTKSPTLELSSVTRSTEAPDILSVTQKPNRVTLGKLSTTSATEVSPTTEISPSPEITPSPEPTPTPEPTISPTIGTVSPPQTFINGVLSPMPRAKLNTGPNPLSSVSTDLTSSSTSSSLPSSDLLSISPTTTSEGGLLAGTPSITNPPSFPIPSNVLSSLPYAVSPIDAALLSPKYKPNLKSETNLPENKKRFGIFGFGKNKNERTMSTSLTIRNRELISKTAGGFKLGTTKPEDILPYGFNIKTQATRGEEIGTAPEYARRKLTSPEFMTYAESTGRALENTAEATQLFKGLKLAVNPSGEYKKTLENIPISTSRITPTVGKAVLESNARRRGIINALRIFSTGRGGVQQGSTITKMYLNPNVGAKTEAISPIHDIDIVKTGLFEERQSKKLAENAQKTIQKAQGLSEQQGIVYRGLDKAELDNLLSNKIKSDIYTSPNIETAAFYGQLNTGPNYRIAKLQLESQKGILNYKNIPKQVRGKNPIGNWQQGNPRLINYAKQAGFLGLEKPIKTGGKETILFGSDLIKTGEVLPSTLQITGVEGSKIYEVSTGEKLVEFINRKSTEGETGSSMVPSGKILGKKINYKVYKTKIESSKVKGPHYGGQYQEETGLSQILAIQTKDTLSQQNASPEFVKSVENKFFVGPKMFGEGKEIVRTLGLFQTKAIEFKANPKTRAKGLQMESDIARLKEIYGPIYNIDWSKPITGTAYERPASYYKGPSSLASDVSSSIGVGRSALSIPSSQSSIENASNILSRPSNPSLSSKPSQSSKSSLNVVSSKSALSKSSQTSIASKLSLIPKSQFSATSKKSQISNYSGRSGLSSISGFSQFSGPSGKSGPSGVSGISGISGTSGISGISASSGYSGRSGYTGYGTTFNTNFKITKLPLPNLGAFTKRPRYRGREGPTRTFKYSVKNIFASSLSLKRTE